MFFFINSQNRYFKNRSCPTRFLLCMCYYSTLKFCREYCRLECLNGSIECVPRKDPNIWEFGLVVDIFLMHTGT